MNKNNNIKTENFHHIDNEVISIIGRTNNCIERFNRHLNKLFLSIRPNLYHFIKVIKEISSVNSLELKISKKGIRIDPEENE